MQSSSSSEESDKENIGPNACNYVNTHLSLKNCLAKTFLDDEAVEEDDSDGERMRYQESDENESDEIDDLDDMIESGNTEAPIDQDKRNELHQKWLEKQDDAETENVLQRLKCQGHGRSSFIEGDSDCYDGSEDDDDNDSNDNCDEAKCDDDFAPKHRTMNTSHQSFKKAKQMIAQMFTDANDVYLPSDDEEIERDFIRHHMLKQNEEPSIISPVEDENSREFFGLIKKLNIAPAAKKRVKASASLFDSLIVSGNRNSSSKSSFLNRANNSLPSSHKPGSSFIKTFIFGRDDSNSRSNISTTEINLDADLNGSSTASNSVTDNKMTSSQLKSSFLNKRKAQADSETSSSLFNILRQSSIKFESKDFNGNHTISESQTDYKFSAFKLRRT